MLNNAVIIPAYNEANSIESTVRSVTHAGVVIVVDDGSVDLTGTKAKQAGAHVVTHKYNMGYDAALQTGFETAVELKMSTVITFDADGQHPSHVLAEVLKCLYKDSCELVLGIRPSYPRLAERIFNLYTRKRFGVVDILCGVKGYHLKLYRSLGWFSSYESVGTELALFAIRSGVSIGFVNVEVKRRSGRSRFGSGFRPNWIIMKAFVSSLFRKQSL